MSGGRVLVTGANGFVGRGLVAGLAVAARPATLAVRSAAAVPAGTRVVPVGGIDSRTEWRDALAGAAAVVHLAAHVHVAPERAEADAALFDEVNHRAALRLFEAASDAGITLFVFLSSITVLGPGSAPGRPFDDLSEPDPVGPYARSKLAAEEALLRAAEGSTTRLVILRPPLVCGPGAGGNLAALARLARTPLPLPFGAVRNRRTLLARDDLVSAILRVLDAPDAAAGRFVLGDARPLSTGDMVRHLREGLGRAPRLLAVPPRLIGLAAAALRRPGLHRRLFGDLEVDSAGFRRAYRWSDAVGAPESLRQTARAMAGGVPGRARPAKE